MKKRAYLTLIILMLVLMPVVLALEVNIKTLPSHKIFVFLREPNQTGVLKLFTDKTGDGILSFTAAVNRPFLDIQVNVDSAGGDPKIREKFYKVDGTGVINLKLTMGSSTVTTEPAVVEEVPVVEEEIVVEEEAAPVEEEVVEEQDKGPGITGKFVGNIKKIVGSKTTYLIIGGIAVVLILGLLVRVGKKKLGSGGSFKVIKASSYDRKLGDAERKLYSAKKELDELKNRKVRLREAKDRFKKDEKDLRRLEKKY